MTAYEVRTGENSEIIPSKAALKRLIANGDLVTLHPVLGVGDYKRSTPRFSGDINNAPEGKYLFVLPSVNVRKSFGSVNVRTVKKTGLLKISIS